MARPFRDNCRRSDVRAARITIRQLHLVQERDQQQNMRLQIPFRQPRMSGVIHLGLARGQPSHRLPRWRQHVIAHQPPQVTAAPIGLLPMTRGRDQKPWSA